MNPVSSDALHFLFRATDNLSYLIILENMRMDWLGLDAAGDIAQEIVDFFDLVFLADIRRVVTAVVVVVTERWWLRAYEGYFEGWRFGDVLRHRERYGCTWISHRRLLLITVSLIDAGESRLII